jgi:acyl CoA:acetate/3-ketoacid CoA transferase alpha subunit
MTESQAFVLNQCQSKPLTYCYLIDSMSFYSLFSMFRFFAFRATTALALVTMLLLAFRLPATAQAPAWQSARAVAAATAAAASNYSRVTVTAVDAAGNVYLAGPFENSVVLGSTTLTSLGSQDVFVAKFNPTSNQFVWAQRAGGTGVDVVEALVMSGTSVYVAGYFTGPTAAFGTTTLTNAGLDEVFVAKLTDAGSTGSFAWALRAGGTGLDRATSLAVSGTSVYVAGGVSSVTADFGAITLPTSSGNYQAYDLFVAKLTDTGATGSFAWAQRAGGTDSDLAWALAVSGTSVYVAGNFISSTAYFGAATLTNSGNAGTTDAFVAKLIDAGSTGSFVWAQRAGGTDYDIVKALAVSGASVYVVGDFGSPTAGFGTTTLTNTGRDDVFVAKLTDTGATGSFAWAQRAGGTGQDRATSLAVSGTSVYVAGNFDSPTASFGSITLTTVASNSTFNLFVAKLTDAGSFVWAQQAAGASANALAVSGTSIYVAGDFGISTASFGSITLVSPSANTLGFLAVLADATLTATAAGQSLVLMRLYPNPARYTTTLLLPVGTTSTPLTLTDVQGRSVRNYPTPSGPGAVLDLCGLPAGFYLLRGVGPAQRLVVE